MNEEIDFSVMYFFCYFSLDKQRKVKIKVRAGDPPVKPGD